MLRLGRRAARPSRCACAVLGVFLGVLGQLPFDDQRLRAPLADLESLEHLMWQPPGPRQEEAACAKQLLAHSPAAVVPAASPAAGSAAAAAALRLLSTAYTICPVFTHALFLRNNH